MESSSANNFRRIHYYPFGLTMQGISSKASVFGQPENKHKFNGIELNSDLELNIYDAFYRNLDPQIGRWWQIDPKFELNINPDVSDDDEVDVEGLEAISPYTAMGNDPIKQSDPKGDIFGIDNLIGAVVGAAVEVGSQMVANAVSGKSLTDISWKQVGVAAVEGGLTSGASTVTKLVVKTSAALASSAIDYVESGRKITSLKDVANVTKNAAIGMVADKATGSIAKVAKGVGGKTVQNVSNKVIGSKTQIAKNILSNNSMTKKTASSIAKTVQSGQKSIAKAVREAPLKTAEGISKGTANPGVTKLKDKTNL